MFTQTEVGFERATALVAVVGMNPPVLLYAGGGDLDARPDQLGVFHAAEAQPQPVVLPRDKLEGRAEAIFAARDRKLEQARERRRLKRQEAQRKKATEATTLLTAPRTCGTKPSAGETEAGSAGAQPARDNRPGQQCEIRTGTDSTARPLPLTSLTLRPRMPQKTQLSMTGEYPLSREGHLSISG